MTMQDELDGELGYLPLDPDEWPDVTGIEPPPDADVADRMLRTMRGLQRRIAEVREAARLDRARTDRFEEQRVAVLQHGYDGIERALASWGRAVNADDPKRATIHLPNGVVSVRKAERRLESRADAETLERIAKEHPGWVRRKPEAAKDPIKKATIPGRHLDAGQRFTAFGDRQDDLAGYHVCEALLPPDRCVRCGGSVVAGDGEWVHEEVVPVGSPCRPGPAGILQGPQADVAVVPGVYWLLPREPKRVTVKPA